MQLYIVDREYRIFFIKKMLNEMKRNLCGSKEHFFIDDTSDLSDVFGFFPDKSLEVSEKRKDFIKASWHGSTVNFIRPYRIREYYHLLRSSFVYTYDISYGYLAALIEMCVPSRLYSIVGSGSGSELLDELVFMNKGKYTAGIGMIGEGECIGDHEICRRCGKCIVDEAMVEGFARYIQTVHCYCDSSIETYLRISKKDKDNTFSIYDRDFLDSGKDKKCNYFVSESCPCFVEHQLSTWNKEQK